MKKSTLIYETPEVCIVMLASNETVLSASAGGTISDVEDLVIDTEF